MQITVKIENTYTGGTVKTEWSGEVPEPLLNDADMEQWWEDHIYPLTGTGDSSGEYAIYEAKITKCDELPQLVGETYEWN